MAIRDWKIFRGIDLDDPKKRTALIIMMAALAGFILLVILLVLNASPGGEEDGKDRDGGMRETVEEAAAGYEGGEAELPHGGKISIFSSKKEAADDSRRNRPQNGAMTITEDFFGDDAPKDRDPFTDDGGGSGSDPFSPKADTVSAPPQPEPVEKTQEEKMREFFGVSQLGAPGQTAQTAPPPPAPSAEEEEARRAAEEARIYQQARRETAERYGINVDDIPDRYAAPADTAAPAPAPEPVQETAAESDKPAPKRHAYVSGGFSTVDGESGWGGEDGFSTVGGNRTELSSADSYMISAMFLKDQKIRNGDRVTVRLLEDVVTEQGIVPKNTPVPAACLVEGSKMHVILTGVTINNRIHTLNYVACGPTGEIGLDCPESIANRNVKQAGNEATNIASSVLSTSITGRIASDIVQSGTSLLRSATSAGGVTVIIPSGYTFKLVKDEHN